MALAHLGHALTSAREAEQAVPVLEKLLATNSTDGEAYADLGKDLEVEGQTAKAIEAYERALVYDQSQYSLHYRLFELYRKSGDAGRAQSHLAAFKAAEGNKQQRYKEGIADL